MTRPLPYIITLLLLAGCASEKAAPFPSGPWQVLGAGRWDIDPKLVPAPVMPAPK